MNIFEFIHQLEGTTINLGEDFPLSKNIDGAKKYPKLYHCTCLEALESIISNNELWLSTITELNDENEIKSFTDEKIKNWFYIASFSKEPILDSEHCNEYGDIFLSIKQEWLLPEFYFLDCRKEKVKTDNFAISAELFEGVGKINPNASVMKKPFEVQVFSFSEVDYTEVGATDITREIKLPCGNDTTTAFIMIPEAGANVKSEEGMCLRWGKDPKWKVWKDEKEIRLKVLIGAGQMTEIPKERLFRRICVKLSSDAFDEFDIAFSPALSDEKKQEYISEINRLFGDRKINYL